MPQPIPEECLLGGDLDEHQNGQIAPSLQRPYAVATSDAQPQQNRGFLPRYGMFIGTLFCDLSPP
jgi:hypothetical protein